MATNSRTGVLITSILTASIMVYLLLAIGTALALRPWIDEGWGAAPAWTLATKGYMGMPCFRAEAWGMTGMERHTYWFMPGFLLIEAAFFKVVGFSLLRLRFLCIAFGAAGFASWIYFLWRLTLDRATTVLFAVLICGDYILMTTAATGRPDIVSFAFQAAAFALYMHFREQNFDKAVLASQTCIMLSGMCHPNGGMLGLIGLCFLTFYLDAPRVRFRQYAIGAIPYAIGSICWGAYILKDPHGFLSQYGFQTGMRFWGLLQPINALKRELLLRYAPAMGLAGHYAGSEGPHWLKTYYFVGYAAAILGTFISPQLRRTRVARTLLSIAGLFFCFMWLLEATKANYYLVYITFPYTAILAIWLRHAWAVRKARVAIAGFGVLFVMLQAGGVLYRIRINQWGVYKPMVAYLKEHARPSDTIFATHDLGFSIGFTRRFLDDPDLGVRTGTRADFIVLEEIFDGRIETVRQKFPKEYKQIQQLLSDYRLVFQHGQYRVLERNERFAEYDLLSKNSAKAK